MSESTPRIVLDTNVCLDLFVFGDPRVAHVRGALQAGDIVALTDDACRNEWLRVLAYPQLGLDTVRHAAAICDFDAWVATHTPAVSASMAADMRRLPRCRDPDDQKFLELAVHSGARWLLSRDEHLLALGRRTRGNGLFDILTPQAWSRPLPAMPTDR